MQVYGTNQVHGPQSANTPHINRPQQPRVNPSSSSFQDELEISSAGLLLEKLRDLPEIRGDKVAQLREAIAAGTYETQDKLSGAVDQLLDEIG